MANPVEVKVILPRWRVVVGRWAVRGLALLAQVHLLSRWSAVRRAEAIGEWIARGAYIGGNGS